MANAPKIKSKEATLNVKAFPASAKTTILDDFILTISDNEDGIPDLDADDDIDPDVANAPAGDEDEERAEADTKRGRKRKAEGGESTKKKKRAKEKATDKDIVHAGDSEGDLDSEFEFQFGENEGVEIGELGEWGFGGIVKSADNGNKQAADIDEIIRKRRERQGRTIEAADSDDEEEVEDNVDEEEKGTDGDDESGGDDDDDDDNDASDNRGSIQFASDDEDLAADGFGGGANSEDEGEDVSGKLDSDSTEGNSEEEKDKNASSGTDSEASDEKEGSAYEAARKAAFFAPESEVPKTMNGSSSAKSFQNMNLSRPILRGLTSVGFTSPTPIQSKTIPVALLGKDVVGGAITGSGKTAAFIVPILERLLYRPKKVPTSRVLILCPTRELAMQCHSVATKLAAFTDITFCAAVGGLSLKVQEAELKKRPDVIIATPGRFIDHMRNTNGLTIETIEILVMDEADRMLEDGFADELNEIISHIPKSRQTMLFSATMTDSVDQLIRLSLNRPVRLMIDNKNSTASTLTQEFIRIRPQKEHYRLAMLLYLVTKIYRTRTIIFFRSKAFAHRARIIFSLFNLKAAELHGSLSQEQRIKSVGLFRDGQVNYLLATDLASRGLDIKGVDIVINYEAPQSHEIYLHRVGRTARAGRLGRAVTLAAESDRKVVKQAVKAAKNQKSSRVVSRVLDPDTIEKIHEKIEGLKEEVDEILEEEKQEKQLAQAEMQVRKGENMIKYEKEINSRPKRTWFESQEDKKKASELGKAQLNGIELPKVKEKLSGKKRKKLDAEQEREEGRIYKKTKEDKAVAGGGKRGGLKALKNKTQEKRKGKSAKKNAVKMGKAKAMKKARK